MDALQVVSPGPLSSVQDLGRQGYMAFGVPMGGAMDQFAARAANWLVGNPQNAATLEMTFMGPTLKTLAPVVLAVTGAEMAPLVDKEPAPLWTAFELKPGQKLSFKPAKAGLRAYLALAGGINAALVMDSRSTNLEAGIGGIQGRALKTGDVLAVEGSVQARTGLALPQDLRPVYGQEIELRVIPGPQDDYFQDQGEGLFEEAYAVSSMADRRGCRLEGRALAMAPGAPASILSEPNLPGVVQVPPNGQPIILFRESTVGGYAKLATVISADLDKAAQAKPGEKIRFVKADLNQARQAAAEARDRLEKIRQALGAK